MTIPNAVSNQTVHQTKSTKNLTLILEELKKSPAMVDATINQVLIGMNGQIDKLKEANSNLGTTTQELQKTQKSLSQSNTFANYEKLKEG